MIWKTLVNLNSRGSLGLAYTQFLLLHLDQVLLPLLFDVRINLLVNLVDLGFRRYKLLLELELLLLLLLLVLL